MIGVFHENHSISYAEVLEPCMPACEEHPALAGRHRCGCPVPEKSKTSPVRCASGRPISGSPRSVLTSLPISHSVHPASPYCDIAGIAPGPVCVTAAGWQHGSQSIPIHGCSDGRSQSSWRAPCTITGNPGISIQVKRSVKVTVLP